MKRFLIAAVLFLACFAPAPAALADGCQLVLGFATMAAAVPQVGQCKEDQHFAANGDAQQATTGGLLVWRKADNWTAFTDGYHTWVNGPFGLQERLNDQRLCWEIGSAEELRQGGMACDAHGNLVLLPSSSATDPEGHGALSCGWVNGVQFKDAYFPGRLYDCSYTNGHIYFLNQSGTRLVEDLGSGWDLTSAGCAKWPAYAASCSDTVDPLTQTLIQATITCRANGGTPAGAGRCEYPPPPAYNCTSTNGGMAEMRCEPD